MTARDSAQLARHALEQVCSRSDPSAAVGIYSPDFHDHVNASEYRGHDGIRKSLGLYQLVFSDGNLRIHVEDQVTEGQRVASRWVAEGHNRGRSIRIWGIVISRIEEGEIVVAARRRMAAPEAAGISSMTQMRRGSASLDRSREQLALMASELSLENLRSVRCRWFRAGPAEASSRNCIRRTLPRSGPPTPASRLREHPLAKGIREDGRCPARTGDLLLVRREQLLRSTAVCRSRGSANDQ